MPELCFCELWRHRTSELVCGLLASTGYQSLIQNFRCCPSGYSCVGSQNTNGYVGCCPAGSNCGAVVNVASVSTVTVYPATQTPTVYVQPQPQPQPSTVMVYAAPEPSPQQAGFCSTLTMKGPDLPRITQGSCGTILIVNRASRSLKPIGYGIAGAFLLTHLAIARVFQWI